MPITAYFFSSTRSVTDRLGEIFNFTWTTAAALWNFRKEVQGFVDQLGHDEPNELHKRFVEGSGVTGADLRTTCLRMSWDEQREQLAKFLLFDLCGLYEAWLENVVPRSVSNHISDVIKSLQFPTRPGKAIGLANGIARVNAIPSSTLKAEIFPRLRAHKKNSWNRMDDLLTAYRYFKEIRNVIIHFGGIADQRVINCRTELDRIPASHLGLKEALMLPAMSIGDNVTVGLRNAVGLSSIIHRLIITLDAALAVSEQAERDLLQRFRVHHKGRQIVNTKNLVKRERAIRNLLGAAGIPPATFTIKLDALLVRHHLINPKS